MHTKRKTNNFLHERITLRESLLVAFAISSFAVLSFSSDTSATVYTASITASPTVTVDLSTNKEADVKSDNVVVNSTCPLGYNLTIVGPSNSNLYKGGDSTASAINATSGTSASPKAITGEGNLDTWGYSLDSNTTISSNTFIGLTNTTNTLINKTSASATSGDTTTIYYGASTSTNKEPGTYTMADSGAITYALTTDINCAYFGVFYDGNGNDNDIHAMDDAYHSNVQENDELTLHASNYIKAGYGFAGWSTVQLDPDDSDFQADLRAVVAAGEVYGPNETITADADFLSQAANIDGYNSIILYAVWVPPTDAIQDWKGCGSLSINQIVGLVDLRDNNVYTVARLADGNCWMTENLRLDHQFTTGNNTDDPNMSNESLAQGYGKNEGTFVGLAGPEIIGFDSTSTNANSIYYSGTQSGTANINIGTTGQPGARFPRYNNYNTAQTVTSMTYDDQNVYSYGNYYSWSAAVANTKAYDTVNQSETSTSICPKGWYVPMGGNKANEANNQYWQLMVTAINNGKKPNNYASSDNPYYQDTEDMNLSNAIRSFPNNFIFSGRVNNAVNQGFSRGTTGGYWSSTNSITNGASANYLFINNLGRVGPANAVGKGRGYSIRCIAQSSYTVHFDANGGSGTMNEQGIYTDQATTLHSSTFTPPTGYYFAGWNTEADGSGTSYANGQSVTNIASSYGTVTLYAQWTDCPPNSICYDDNGASSVTTMSNQTIAATDTERTLWASNFQRAGYGFAGWNTKADGTGASYGPNETISFVEGQYNTGGLKLYAIWVESAGTLQSWSGCSSMSVGDITALSDNRDNNTYAVAKLADEKCWMIENLRLDNTATLTTSNTHNPLFNIYLNRVAIKNNNGTTTNHLSASVDPASGNWCRDYTDDCISKSMLNTTNTVPGDNTMTSSNDDVYSYGNYYNWYSATAGQGTYSSTTVNGTMSGDICPHGWRLPIGGNKNNESLNDFWQLAVVKLNNNVKPANYDSSLFPNYATSDESTPVDQAMRKYPNNFVHSGDTDAIIRDRGHRSYYYTATSSSANNYSYDAVFSADFSGINNQQSKHTGEPVRCIANN